MFPGPLINATTNDNIHVNVFNDLDDPLLFTWYLLFNTYSSLSFPLIIILMALDKYSIVLLFGEALESHT